MTNIENAEKFEREGFEICRELNPIFNRVKPSIFLGDFKEYFLDCIDPKTPSHKRNLVRLIRMNFDNLRRDINEKDLKSFLELREKAENWLKSAGYRYGTLTAQEHRLLGGTVEERYMQEPYKPTSLVDSDSTLDEMRKARDLTKYFGIMALDQVYHFPKNFNKKSGLSHRLEPLDDEGRTVRDPTLLDENFKEIKHIKRMDNFPFKRK